jgi:hypothetical protein
MADEAANNFKVSAVGGAGSAGQPAQYMSGGAYGEGQENMDLQTAAKMNKSGVQIPKGVGQNAPTMNMGESVTPLNAFTTEPDVHPANGAALGPGQGPEALASTGMLDMQNNEDMMKLKAVLPIYKAYAETPNATNAFRNFTRWVDSQ